MQRITGVMVGLRKNAIVTTLIPEVVSKRRELDLTLYDMARTLENPGAR